MRIEILTNGSAFLGDKVEIIFLQDVINVFTTNGYMQMTASSLVCNGQEVASRAGEEITDTFRHWWHEVPVGNAILKMGVWQGTLSRCYYAIAYPTDSVDDDRKAICCLQTGHFLGHTQVDIKDEKTLHQLLACILEDTQRR